MNTSVQTSLCHVGQAWHQRIRLLVMLPRYYSYQHMESKRKTYGDHMNAQEHMESIGAHMESKRRAYEWHMETAWRAYEMHMKSIWQPYVAYEKHM